jgi:radical SAM protein with 4Fe4S-binding SPASM domain
MQDNITRYSEKDIELILTKHLGERYASYRQIWHSVNYLDFPNFPIHIDFELNDFCNQSCIMCPRNLKSHPNINYKFSNKHILDFNIFKKVIDEGINKGLMSINLGAFAEPLLNHNVFKMIKYASSKGIIDTRVITNGLLLDKYINDVFDSNLINLFISIDAYSESNYYSIRGSGFNKVIDNLNLILQERTKRQSLLPIIRVSFVDMDRNRYEKELFINEWKDKVDFIDIQVFDNYNVDISQDFDLSKKKKWNCYSPFARLAILANGEVLPCCNFFGRNIPVESLQNYSIEEIWKSQKLESIRNGIILDTNRNCSICQRIGE